MTQPHELRPQLDAACRRLLSALDRDPYSPTFGCFDRRYWAWKLVDAPELTYQRNALMLAWQLARGGSGVDAGTLAGGVRAAFRFCAARQHRDGSFDQAFPGEHSYGATAFLLHDLALAVEYMRAAGAEEPPEADQVLRNAAGFLSRSREQHAVITNHLAGAAAGLLACRDVLHAPDLTPDAARLLDRIVASQHREGWFPEYGGADPGYQSLCVYYLAAANERRPDPALTAAIARGVDFMTWFAQPDGTFGGEYGSRRTAVLYPGGIARVAAAHAGAAALTRFAVDGIVSGRLPGIDALDLGNVAPMAASLIAAIDAPPGTPGALPYERDADADFPDAGLFVRVRGASYAIVGASNGGVIKVFDRIRRVAVYDDAGYVAAVRGRGVVTSQTRDDTRWSATPSAITVDAPFSRLPRLVPTPGRFIALRALGLTAFRSGAIREWVKRALVARLITPSAASGMRLRRDIQLGADHLVITDRLAGAERLEWIEWGRPFVSVHMASARYYPGFAGVSTSAERHVPSRGVAWVRTVRVP